MGELSNKQDTIDLRKIFRLLLSKRRSFVKMWCIVAVLSCIWIFPQPRFYRCEVSLAPEASGEDLAGGLSSIASSFGFNLGGMMGSDAIYPSLYPDLFESPEFLVSLFDIQIQTIDGNIQTDYRTYLKKHQKKNWLTQPFKWMKKKVTDLFEKKREGTGGGAAGINYFHLSTDDYNLMLKLQDIVSCTNDKKTDVTTITVEDQDPLVSALLADSIRVRLQRFIIDYRTRKARLDCAYYQNLVDSALVEYEEASKAYSAFCDAHINIQSKAYSQMSDALENEKDIKLQTYNAMCAQLQAYKAKVQERTPAFTVLKSATVPIKPAGPKRVLFVLGMLILSTFCYSFWLSRRELHFIF